MNYHNELATKQDILLVKQEIIVVKQDLENQINSVRQDMKHLEDRVNLKLNKMDFKLNIVIAIAALSLTFFNPALLDFLAKVFKLS